MLTKKSMLMFVALTQLLSRAAEQPEQELKLGPTIPEVNSKVLRAKKILTENKLSPNPQKLQEAIEHFRDVLNNQQLTEEQVRKIENIIRGVESTIEEVSSYDHLSRLELNDDEEASSPKNLEKHTVLDKYPEEKS